jgi:radical SAM protein with 4Fe4S-binding SPASM domain
MTRRLDVINNEVFPAYGVWELTLRCDQRCMHCGSRASRARPGELNLEQALQVVDDLKVLKTKEVILIGGEAYLHENFLEIIKALRAAHINVAMTTGGQGIDEKRACEIKKAGIDRVSVSIDGLEQSHDRVRARKGSFINAFNALNYLKNAHIKSAVNTTINNINKSELELLYELLRDHGITAWQVQIIAPLGRAADQPDLLLQPYDLLDIIPRLAKLKEQAFNDNILIMPGNNLGYFAPQEALLPSPKKGMSDYFAGCQAGKFILGIESNGTIKGCPSLQTSYYAAGTIKDKSLKELWHSSQELISLRTHAKKELWGFCKSCDFAQNCQGGCTFTAHSLFGKAGNNPYCFHRAHILAKKGIYEHLERVSVAPKKPFDHALFTIVNLRTKVRGF